MPLSADGPGEAGATDTGGDDAGGADGAAPPDEQPTSRMASSPVTGNARVMCMAPGRPSWTAGSRAIARDGLGGFVDRCRMPGWTDVDVAGAGRRPMLAVASRSVLPPTGSPEHRPPRTLGPPTVRSVMARISPFISLAARHAEHDVPYFGCPRCMRHRPVKPFRDEKQRTTPRSL